MHKYINLLFLLILFTCQSFVQPARAPAEQKSLKESMADLKKSFHPDKAFIMPFSDTTNEDLQAFLFSVQGTEGVKGADLKMENGKAVITVDTKTSMVTMWNHLEKEFKNRYTVTDRTPKGFVLADSYQTNNQTSAANKEATKDVQKQNTKDVQKQNTKSVYEQAEQDAAKDYQNPDTSKGNKSIWQQQKDYAEQMRQRDKDRANEIYGKNNNLYYKNPENYVTAAPKEKGEWYVEYTLNGKKVTMYLADEKLLNHSAGKVMGEINCHFLTTKPYKVFDLAITNPASYPDVKKFEFGKPAVYSKMFKAGVYDAPKAPVSEHALVEFHFWIKILRR